MSLFTMSLSEATWRVAVSSEFYLQGCGLQVCPGRVVGCGQVSRTVLEDVGTLSLSLSSEALWLQERSPAE